MRELPILFPGGMIPAILDGRKTQTRRTDGLELVNQEPDAWTYLGFEDGMAWFKPPFGTGAPIGIRPRYQVGDHLWGRETWRLTPNGDEPWVEYKADVTT